MTCDCLLSTVDPDGGRAFGYNSDSVTLLVITQIGFLSASARSDDAAMSFLPNVHVAPFARLPTELANRIFRNAVHSARIENAAPIALKLASVCHFWRVVATGDVSLWRRFDISFDRCERYCGDKSQNTLHDYLALLLERSRDAYLNVVLHLPTALQPLDEELLDLFLPSILARADTLALLLEEWQPSCGEPLDWYATVFPLLAGPAPILRLCTLSSDTKVVDIPDDEDLLQGCTSLDSLSLRNVSLRRAIPLLPLDTVRHLTLRDGTSSSSLRDLHVTMPRLQSLALHADIKWQWGAVNVLSTVRNLACGSVRQVQDLEPGWLPALCAITIWHVDLSQPHGAWASLTKMAALTQVTLEYTSGDPYELLLSVPQATLIRLIGLHTAFDFLEGGSATEGGRDLLPQLESLEIVLESGTRLCQECTSGFGNWRGRSNVFSYEHDVDDT